MGNKITTGVLWARAPVGGCTLRGPEKGDHSDIPRVYYLRCKKTWTGSVKVNIDLCQGSYKLRM